MRIRNIKSSVALISSVGTLAVLFSPSIALATDGASEIQSFIKSIVTTLVGISGAVAVVFMVIGGFHYMTSAGNPEKLQKAKHTLLYAGVGLTIVLAAYLIVDFVSGIAKASFGG